jgi:retron-type reverse transcriptase
MFKTKKSIMSKMKQFLRIANARLRKVYKNKRQRKAWAANMWRRYIDRQNIEKDL